MWLTKLETEYLKIGQYLDMTIIILPLAVILLAIRKENSITTISVFQRICMVIYIGAVSFSIYDPFLYCYHNYINPEWFNYFFELKREELIIVISSQKEIGKIDMRIINNGQNEMFKLSTLLPSVIIIPSFVAFLSLVFIRNKQLTKKTSEI
jgi:hypothetical protein